MTSNGEVHRVGSDAFLVVENAVLRFPWGAAHELGSAAFWVDQARSAPAPNYRIGTTLREEVAACILGGYGVPAGVALAAFHQLRRTGLFRPERTPSETEIEAALRLPFDVGGRLVRYRFAAQRSARLAGAFSALDATTPPAAAVELRQWLMTLPGIGPKTASWITRNVSDADGIAVIDIHVHRAGLAAGFFASTWRLPRDYFLFEAAFAAVAREGEVTTTALDIVIWDTLQRLGRFAQPLLGGCGAGSSASVQAAL